MRTTVQTKCAAAGLVIAMLLLSPALFAAAADDENQAQQSRFFFGGDGRIELLGRKSGHRFSGVYRTGGTYDPKAMAAVARVFDAPDERKLSLRLIEFIDYLQDRLAPGQRITIISGYRSPQYNTNLRNQGRLAAKASLHQYGMAADLMIAGVPARRIWDYVKSLGFGGAGYYGGDYVHIDVGPARCWDQKTSGVGTGISDDNKLIGIVSDYDRYSPGELQQLRFIRMTAFPIGVSPEFFLERVDDRAPIVPVMSFTAPAAAARRDACPRYRNIDEMAGFDWHLPAELSPGRYRVRARFCGNDWAQMPAEVQTPEFELRLSK